MDFTKLNGLIAAVILLSLALPVAAVASLVVEGRFMTTPTGRRTAPAPRGGARKS